MMLFLSLSWPYRLILEKQLFYITYFFFCCLHDPLFIFVFWTVWLWCARYWISLLGFSEFLGSVFDIFPFFFLKIIGHYIFKYFFCTIVSLSPFSETTVTGSLDHLIISYTFWMLCSLFLHSIFFFFLCFSLGKFYWPFFKFLDISLEVSEADESTNGIFHLWYCFFFLPKPYYLLCICNSMASLQPNQKST